ncbi:unnamed protein product [Sordaria macrospora k-hell]|uniref:Class E vacuolar protein-sorting machinery protein HSE1 n=1 Tax=Sordaria macrospora (strain ATCC MYA-333 / DSM 997 / K(L3346) / K-hell) TaxID=771870 RepID=F7VQM6_SORMK|nr:uncharacterized protein SMAC_01374 [Sordaria macrospora k-hell]CCC07808.1 unnamed protein product [Sordaria macrospora k-hell]
MVSVDRQRIIETNRSLRLIKNSSTASPPSSPAEASLSGSTSSTPVPAAPRAVPAAAAAAAAQPQPPVPVGGGGVSSIAARFQQNPPPAVSQAANAFSNLSRNNPTPSPAPGAPAPPSYAQSTSSSSAPPPPLPGRSQPPTPAPASKPIIAHCKALYKYDASDARDCSFDKGDKIHVYEYMNADWWMGRCVRTGQEGIFPKSYVEVEAAPVQSTNAWDSQGGYQNEKSAAAGGYPGAGGYGAGGPGYGGYEQPQPTYGGGYVAPPPGPPPAGQVYDPNAPQGEKEESKFEKHGKSIGKKFGNAAVFGAGATVGANLVNSIF